MRQVVPLMIEILSGQKTKTGIATLASVGFDELNQEKWMGETQALDDIVKIGSVRLRKFEFDPHVSYYELLA